MTVVDMGHLSVGRAVKDSVTPPSESDAYVSVGNASVGKAGLMRKGSAVSGSVRLTVSLLVHSVTADRDSRMAIVVLLR